MRRSTFFTGKSIKMVGFFLMMMLLPSHSFAGEPINMAGVYEYDAKPNGVRKQMYLTLDFINGVPDFTQVFTGKESNFRRLPKDFMNAKKLCRNFSGTKAPGFGKFKEKWLFSNTEEFKLTNPRVDDGLIIADWVNNKGEKGECQIVVKEDRSLRIIGLTKFSRDISPDEIEIGLVEDRLPAGVEPFVSPKEVVDYVVKENDKTRLTPKVTPYWEDVDVQVVRAEQKGNTIDVRMKMKLKSTSKYDKVYITSGKADRDNTWAETKDGTRLTKFKSQTPGNSGDEAEVPVKKDAWSDFSITFYDVPGTVDYITTMKFDNYVPAFYFDNLLTIIENIPVFQQRPRLSKK